MIEWAGQNGGCHDTQLDGQINKAAVSGESTRHFLHFNPWLDQRHRRRGLHCEVDVAETCSVDVEGIDTLMHYN